MFALLGLLWWLHPLLAAAASVVALIYYCTLSFRLYLGMLLMTLVTLLLLYVLPVNWVLPLSLLIFVLAWTGQFIGHYVEGKKPSFFDDVRFLLIGPLFILCFLYRKFHIPV